MAASKKVQDIFDGEDVIVDDGITVTAVQKEEKDKGPMVDIYLPRLEDDGSMKVDQYEHVTIANEEGEKTWRVKRGERVSVPVSVFLIMKQKYPDL